jgi:hypothetical protein
MARLPSEHLGEPTIAQVADVQDLRRVIVASLAATPIYEHSLRRSVWTFVGAHREIGTSPGHIILSLTEAVDAAKVTPMAVRQALTRQMILWCVEAYFGRLGGPTFERSDDRRPDSSAFASRTLNGRP